MNQPNNRPVTDGVKLALLTNRLEGVARKMANTLLRSGRSGVLNIARDFSCCIVTADCHLLAAAESLPIHVLCGPDMMAASMKSFHPELRRGDAYLHNSPYHGCSHPADHTILVPVMDDDGVHRFTVVAKAHQADCGNSEPTTYMGSARDVYHEGALIFPAVKVQQDYKNIDDIVRMCKMRIRVPEQWWGDYLAMMGAARIGERELVNLAREIGWDTLDDYARDYLDYSEQRMIGAIKKLASGQATRSSTHDPLFPGMPEEGVTIQAVVTVDAESGRIQVDLRDNPDCLPCGLNLSEATARTAAMVGIFNSVEHTVPKNAGAFRRIDILLRENCVVGIPLHPTSCSVATTNMADRVANSVQTAMAEMDEGAGLAECGAVIPPAIGVISGIDPTTGHRFINQLFLGFTGGAAGPHADAWQTIGHVGNAGLCFQDSVELDEMRHPLLVRTRRFVQDSEGAGRHNGARSMYVEFGPVGCEMQVGYVSDGTINGPKGVRGGLAGANSSQFKRLKSGELVELPGGAMLHLADGETVLSYSCGGGGYGRPEMRDPELVRRDVEEGYLSRERARSIYGVVLSPASKVDTAATDALRAATLEAISASAGA
ncbi:hydantoinase B/oxoprolinase family protein [Caballeronia sp. SEWSISQ10-4 2]|uniref:hydantoinase B/oxoprolinase family protein n=1 Tax=Caballeronia sp. SEWSISQ10-4 2 TaxID=2937438 RepID=UPI00264E123F|nr:hydantoinase B/oxoprolinase family protein [Caballeronia sp. SEWSISQ10-4 2]MDN7182267.1 hydantoinase B/oxoprolinase family protein [Caballeronia sp. SEWSISQ10-4 2]